VIRHLWAAYLRWALPVEHPELDEAAARKNTRPLSGVERVPSRVIRRYKEQPPMDTGEDPDGSKE